MKKKKNLLIVIGTAVVVLILAIGIYLSMKNGSKKVEEDYINIQQLETDFGELFNNQENEYVRTLYNIEEEKSGKYDINICLPFVLINENINNKINNEINDVFVQKLLQIINETEKYTILKIDYASSVNENIISLVIRCVLKEGNNAQRTIIKTYNYNLETLQEVNIMDVIPEEKASDIQNQINQKIEKQIQKEETIIQQGYKVYRRDKASDIYILKNATEFYINNNILYIIYSYGNSNYTSEVDLIINKI